MNANAWQLVAEIIAAVLASAGLGEAIKAIFRRGPARAEAAAQVNDMTVKWAAALQADAELAHQKVREISAEAELLRSEVREDREELRSLRGDVTRLSNEVQAMTSRMRHWRRAILSPDASLEVLRQMVSSEPGENGIYSKEF